MELVISILLICLVLALLPLLLQLALVYTAMAVLVVIGFAFPSAVPFVVLISLFGGMVYLWKEDRKARKNKA